MAIALTVCLIQMTLGSKSGWPSVAILASSWSCLILRLSESGKSRMMAFTGFDTISRSYSSLYRFSHFGSQEIPYLRIEPVDVFKLGLGPYQARGIGPLYHWVNMAWIKWRYSISNIQNSEPVMELKSPKLNAFRNRTSGLLSRGIHLELVDMSSWSDGSGYSL